MLQLHNSSPFVPALFGFPDQRGVDTLVVVIKATFEFGPTPILAGKQRPVVLADEHFGDPTTTSLRYPSEVHLGKPGTDVIVVGHARAPNNQPVTEHDVAIGVGDRLAHLRVYGDRFWTQGLRAVVPSQAQPFVHMPVVYERAYGGPAEPRNPVGRGMLEGRSEADMLGQPVANLEDPRSPLISLGQASLPVGLAAIAPTWQPRVAHAGTYDERWRKTRAPYLPVDYDARYMRVASPGLSFDQPLQGGEPISLHGFHPEGRWRFSLPQCRLDVRATVAGGVQTLAPVLDTALFEPDEQRFTMTWRAILAVGEQLLRVERVDVGLGELVGAIERPAPSAGAMP